MAAKRDFDARFLGVKPLPAHAIAVLFGNDAPQVDSALRRYQHWFRSVSPEAKLSSETPNAIDAAQLGDFLNSTSLFGETELLCVAGITERHAKIIDAALETLSEGTGSNAIALCSNTLKSKSKLLDRCRSHPRVLVISCYESRIERDQAALLIETAGLKAADTEAVELLCMLSDSQSIDAVTATLELAGLHAAPGDVLTTDLLRKVLPSGNLLQGNEILGAMLAPERGELLLHYRSEIQYGASAGAYLARTAYALEQMRSFAASGGSSFLPWPIKKRLQDALRQRPSLGHAAEQALVEIHQTERTLRSVSVVEDEEVERCLLRIHHMLSRR
ncbi:MAG: hypothetical protein MRY63_12500 [Neomegalonema sp.]|nr:hypothetical protein [Neomegalonema sp.]